MIERRDAEYALLLKVVQEQNFDILIKNNMTADSFSEPGRAMYNHIEEYLNKYSEYMHVHQLIQLFDIDQETYTDLMNLGTLEYCMDYVKSKYATEQVLEKIDKLNLLGDLARDRPMEFIREFDAVNDELKLIGREKKSVNLLDDIDDILKIDMNNVIKTGFKELDDRLGGWNRGEDLITLMGRPRTRKIFYRVKIFISSSITR